MMNSKPISNRIMKVSLLLVAALVGSCNDFLNEAPDNRVALNDLDKAAQLLTNAYSVASPAFTDWMTDNTAYTRGVTIRQIHQRAFEWQDFVDDPNESDSPSFFWFQTYNAIAHANEVLAVLSSLPADTEALKQKKRAVESEARLVRAYGHFMLVNLFGKHYDASTADSDQGVPYVETPETVFIKTYKRNTVQEVYDKVEADMLKGIELVDDSFFANSGKYHFNKNAALAFATRFYLFKGNYDKVIEYANLLLGADPGSFVRDLTSEEFQAASSSVQAYPQLYSSPQQRSNLLLMRKISLVQRVDFAHGPTGDVYDEVFSGNPFGGTDERENPSFVKGQNGQFPAWYESLFERSSLNSNVGLPYHIGLMFRGEEVLLNRAEALAQKNRITEAITDIQTLANKRYSGNISTITITELRNFYGVGTIPTISNRAVVIEYVINERRREFITQGMRWYDIKRFEIPVEHVLVDGSTIELEGDDLRKVLQIPTSAIDVAGLKPNPR
ncbi:MAG: RagB/SusD family nutrient uptake outer membrane protein [Cyclobacteriaceae bacterium]|nr:RagB/SusD family nutrient uptake outer membrane protein [Cyclobacteriaceae bacterium]